eukprot:1396136-Rhodomonas_salina.2
MCGVADVFADTKVPGSHSTSPDALMLRPAVRRKSSLIPGRAGNESTRDGIDGAESKQFQVRPT